MPQLDGKQIKDTSVALTKLASSVLRPDVAVAWTVDQNAGSQRLTSLGAPTSPSDAARLQDVQNIPWKTSVRAATTANITLSGTQTVDGVSLIANDRCLVKNQTTTTENGIYVVAAGAWARSADNDSTAEMQGAVVVVREGTVNADKRFAQTTDDVIIDTSSPVWVDIGTGGSAAYPVSTNKAMAALLTTADFQKATNTTVASTPAGDGYVMVDVNGHMVEVGDGVKTKECYFSSDTGTTAKSIANIAAGDELFWVGSVALYELATTDKINFYYTV